MAVLLTLQLFGEFRARLNGAPLPGLHLREGDRLLAYLALRHDTPVTYSALARQFWPAEARTAENLPVARGEFPNTRQAVRSLRQALGREAHRLASVGKGVVQLDLAHADVDLLTFDTGVQGETADDWRRAVECYRAPLLEGWTEKWAEEARKRCRGAFERALRRLVENAAAREAWEEADWFAHVFADRAPGEAAQSAKRFVEERKEAWQDAVPPVFIPGRSQEVIPAIDVQAALQQPPASPSGPADPPLASMPTYPLEPFGGAVPLDSPFYVERRTDLLFREAIDRGDSIVLVKGARQMGKTSLLARGLQHAREQGRRVVLTDFQALHEAQLASQDSLFRGLAVEIAMQLDSHAPARVDWDPELGPNLNLELFLRRHALKTTDGPLIWGLDEVDRLFSWSYGTEVFGLFRSWHNRRSLDPSGPWSRLTLGIAYATEAQLFIQNLNQSPFNVGTRLELDDFTEEQVAALNTRYGSPLRTPEEVSMLCRLLEGHPYLTRRALDELASGQIDYADLIGRADRDDGPFGDHLRRLLAALAQDVRALEAVRSYLREKIPPAIDLFYRLRSGGLLSGGAPSESRFRCPLYGAYLSRQLL